MALDPFKSVARHRNDPAAHIDVIIPSDVTDLPRVTRAICVAESGFVRLVSLGGDEADVYIAAGVPFPIQAVRVLATGTTASGLRGLS